jgi:hypothetical protein
VECTSPRKVVRNLKEFQALAPATTDPKSTKDEIFIWENPLPPSPAQQAAEDSPWWEEQVSFLFDCLLLSPTLFILLRTMKSAVTG